jgi:hypothetical protein
MCLPDSDARAIVRESPHNFHPDLKLLIELPIFWYRPFTGDLAAAPSDEIEVATDIFSQSVDIIVRKSR